MLAKYTFMESVEHTILLKFSQQNKIQQLKDAVDSHYMIFEIKAKI